MGVFPGAFAQEPQTACAHRITKGAGPRVTVLCKDACGWPTAPRTSHTRAK